MQQLCTEQCFLLAFCAWMYVCLSPCNEKQGRSPRLASGCQKGYTSARHRFGILNWTVCRVSSYYIRIFNLILLLYFSRLCLPSKLPFISSMHNCIRHLPSENWAEYLEIITLVCPFTKLFCKTWKNWESLPAAAAAPCMPAAARFACTFTHTYAARAGVALRMGCSCVWNKQQRAAEAAVCHTKGVTHTFHVCFNQCIAIEGMCTFTW